MAASPAVRCESGSRDEQLKLRARQVMPGGIGGHLDTRLFAEYYPQFFERGEGAYLWDVQGRKYIDFMGGYGPVVLGYRNGEVDEAVRRQLEKGDCLTGPTELAIELAERLVEIIPAADWAMFSKNGTDATSTCLLAARAFTGKRKIIKARMSYHGATLWCTPVPVGVTPEDRANIIEVEWNDCEALRRAVDEVQDDLAGILLGTFMYQSDFDSVLVDPAFARLARELATQYDAAFILDEVRTGMRLDMRGSWHELGVEADLSAWSKALGNGYPIAAVTGKDRLREAASRIFVTGSFWFSASSMAASLATIGQLIRVDGIAHMQRMGMRLRDGLAAHIDRYGVPIVQSGPPQMPTILFRQDDETLPMEQAFFQYLLDNGVYIQPKHNNFISVAHSEADIDHVIDVAGEAMRRIAARP